MLEPAGLILAGGRSTRMGTPKAQIALGEHTLLERCIDRLSPQVNRLAVNTNTTLPTDLPQIADTMDGHLGPLAGILAGLIWAKDQGAQHMVSVAVDTPFFPCDLVPHLLMAADDTGLAIASTADGEHGTFGLWPVSLITPLTAFLTDGGRKVRTFTQSQNAKLAPFHDTTPPAFFNINTPADLQQAAAWL